MYLALIAVAAGALTAVAAGGRLAHLAQPRIRAIGLLAAGAACELVASEWIGGGLGAALVISGYALLIGWAVVNVRLAGMVLIAVGLLSNLLVICVDGGMPVRGAPPGASFGGRHHAERPGDHLTGLADIIVVRPIDQTVSAGDIVLAAGAATVTFGLLRPPRRRLSAPSR